MSDRRLPENATKASKRSTHLRHAAVFVAFTASIGVASVSYGGTPVPVRSRVTVTDVKSDPGVPAFSQWRPRFVTLRHPTLDMGTLRVQAASSGTIPFWTSVVTSPLDGHSYTTSMVGNSPFAVTKTNTSITYVPIIARFHFSRGTVLDPTLPACNDNVPIATRFFNSPLFMPLAVTSNGVAVSDGGGSQLISAYQRANFWSSVSGSGYGVTLVPSAAPVVVDVNAPRRSTVSMITVKCGTNTRTVPLGQISISDYDAIIRNLISSRATPAQLPIVLTYNLVQTSNGCCILGYHNAVPVRAGTQTYAVGSYIDSGIFSGVDDVTIWGHELAEWMDDPFVQAAVPGGGADDLTPAWGHVGQVSGCQNNLENADPLTGTEFAIAGSAGFTYHIQDVAFEDWFYRTPSQGTAGLYSFLGVFAGTQGACF